MNKAVDAGSLKTVDALVIGSGAGGLSSAISAKLEGLDVLIVEKGERFGGTTARSGGMMWVPGNSLAKKDGIADSREAALSYVQAEAGNMYDEARVSAYLDAAPLMIDEYAERTSAMRFVSSDFVADNHQHLPGAVLTGRTVTVPVFDGRELGKELRNLAKPLGSLTFLGMMIQPGAELNHFMNAFKSWKSFRFVAARMAGRLRDAIFWGRSTRLTNGNALAGRLAKSALDLGVPIWCSTSAKRLLTESGRVVGAVVEREGRTVEIRARYGVVLATGGFPHDKERRRNLSPFWPEGAGAYALGAEQNVGDGMTMGESVGGKVEDRLFNTVSWTPVSRTTGRDGKPVLFPHGFDRTKPGFIAVTRKGRRFANETAIGNDFIRAMMAECEGGPVEGFLLCDHKAIRKFGNGLVRPAPVPMTRHLRSGYLIKGNTLRELAAKAGIDADALEAEVKRYNAFAETGVDLDFKKGGNELERRSGDPQQKPNPNVGPLSHAPFYAVKLLPGDFSTLAGLRTDAQARVIDAQGRVIPGLYAAGNDNSTMAGGNSPSGGFTLGPAMTFGFIAGRHLATQARAETKGMSHA